MIFGRCRVGSVIVTRFLKSDGGPRLLHEFSAHINRIADRSQLAETAAEVNLIHAYAVDLFKAKQQRGDSERVDSKIGKKPHLLCDPGLLVFLWHRLGDQGEDSFVKFLVEFQCVLLIQLVPALAATVEISA